MQIKEHIDGLVAQLKSEVERAGGVTVGREDLRLLCPDNLTASEQFMTIASLAHGEGWSFAFLPDGTVRFGCYAKA